MKKTMIGITLVTLMITCSLNTYAKPWNNHEKPERFEKSHGQREQAPAHREKNDARYVIHRTAQVIYEAQKAIRYRHRNAGLSRAIAHQQLARDLYGRGIYQDAIYHSLRARDIAMQIISDNRRRINRNFYRDQSEETYAQNAPRNSELDLKIDSGKLGRDDDAVKIRLHLDLD